MNFRILHEDEYAYWDDFVDRSPQGSIYAKSYYLDSKDCDYEINIIERDRKIMGGIILCRNELRIYSNPLFVKYLGVLYADDDLIGIKSKRRKNKIDRILLKNISLESIFSYDFHPNFDNWLSFYWNNFNQTTKYTYQICFDSENSFRESYTSKVRGPLENAKKYNLRIVDIGIKEFCETIVKSYSARNTKPPYKKDALIRFLNKLLMYNCFYYKAVVDSNDNVHAAAGIVYNKSSSNLILNGSDPEYRKYCGNTLIIDHMIEFSSDKSKIFDFEGSMHERIERFYFGFGGELVPYFSISKNNFFTKLYLSLLSFIKFIYK